MDSLEIKFCLSPTYNDRADSPSVIFLSKYCPKTALLSKALFAKMLLILGCHSKELLQSLYALLVFLGVGLF